MQLSVNQAPASLSLGYKGVSQYNLPKKISFVIADDNPDDQFLIQHAIKLIDQNVEHSAVFNGRQLIDILTSSGVYNTNFKYSPSAIILDLCMPVMDGLMALKLIRKLDYLKDIPIFILHSSREDDYVSQCSELGVAAIYTKPCQFTALQMILKGIYHSCGGSNSRMQD